MIVSSDSVLALQRHFLGALSAPARTWLEPSPAARIAFAGSAIRLDGGSCVLDWDTVASPGEERHEVRLFHPGGERVEVRIGDMPPWLTARWRDDPGESVVLAGGEAAATLVVIATHDAEGACRGAVRLHVTQGDLRRVEELIVHVTARRSNPTGDFDFNGSPVPRPFDFGVDERSYELSIASRSAVPLVVTFADLPAWLGFEVDGHRRNGPIPAVFFERAAPFRVQIRPQLMGQHYGSIRVQTNDRRAEMQFFELQFSARITPLRPHVRAIAPHAVQMRADQSFVTYAALENWGRTPARIARNAVPQYLALPELPVVPAAQAGRPGTVPLPISVPAGRLAPGAYTFSLTLGIEGGEPAEVEVPLHVDVSPASPRRGVALHIATLAALGVLFLLTIVFVLVVGGS